MYSLLSLMHSAPRKILEQCSSIAYSCCWSRLGCCLGLWCWGCFRACCCLWCGLSSAPSSRRSPQPAGPWWARYNPVKTRSLFHFLRIRPAFQSPTSTSQGTLICLDSGPWQWWAAWACLWAGCWGRRCGHLSCYCAMSCFSGTCPAVCPVPLTFIGRSTKHSLL